ncbi:copper resistance CopC family protein [Kitasatospora griseola]|uniref:copper resistance CopC family protein n=1 Tax=Kitasatospora griseola TaxID=2064 RepID=UPI00382252BF
MKLRVPSLLTALLLAAPAVLVPAPQAVAHAQLLASGPAADSVVSESPAVVTLSFDSPVQPGFTTIAVVGTDGKPYADGAPTAVGHDLQQKVARLPQGLIRVTWRTVAADGAPLQGRFAFTNADPAAPTQPPARPETSPAAAPAPAATREDTGDWRWWAAAGGLSVAAAAGVIVFVRRSDAARDGGDGRRR